MPHEWRFSGLSNASPSSSESPTARIADATQAFIDRRTIDWSALRQRMPGAPGRALIENLRIIETLRESANGGLASEGHSTAPRALWVVAVLAWLHTLWSLTPLVTSVMAATPAHVRAPPLALALAFTAASVILAGAVRRDRRGLALLAVFAATGTAFARGTFEDTVPHASLAVSLLMRGVFPEAFVPACLWEFARTFPRVCRFTVFDRVARASAAAAWVLGSLLFIVNLALAYHLVTAPFFLRFAREQADSGFWKLFAVVMAPAAVAIFVRARAAQPEERDRVLRLSCAIAVGAAPFFLIAVLRTVLTSVDAWLLTSSAIGNQAIDIVVTTGLAAIPVMSTVVLLVDRPFERLVPGRLLHRLLVVAVHVLIVAPFAMLAVTIYRLRYVSLVSVADGAGTVLLGCIVVGAGLVVLRRRMLEALARLSTATDMKRELTRVLDALRVARGEREIAHVLRRAVGNATRAESTRVLTVAPGGIWLDAWTQETLPDGAMVAMLRESTLPLDVAIDGPLASLLPESERIWLQSRRVELVLAVKRLDGRIVAIVACGPKHGGAPFDRHQLWFLTTLAAAAGASWDLQQSVPHRSAGRTRRTSAEVAFECLSCGRVRDSAQLTCGCTAGLSLAALPRRLGNKFVIERRLGSGGMGVVYLARDTRLDRMVALKTLPRLRDGAVAHLRREARAMAKLNHPSLATIYGLEMWRGTPVLVVEYFPAGTLADRLAVAPLTDSETIRLGMRLAGALDYMHARGMLHKDLKPANVAMSDGLPVLLDFGLVSLGSPESSEAGSYADDRPAGTRGYLPPEAYGGSTATRAIDLWALAVVMLEALSGSRPEAEFSATHEAADLTVALRRAPDLVPFFQRALAHDASRRFRTAGEMATALREIERARTSFPHLGCRILLTCLDDAAHEADTDDDQCAGNDPDLTHAKSRRPISEPRDDEQRPDEVDNEVSHHALRKCKVQETRQGQPLVWLSLFVYWPADRGSSLFGRAGPVEPRTQQLKRARQEQERGSSDLFSP